LRSAILVFSATGCAGTGAAHAALAKAANTVINVVDMPEHCEAMTPSIVDRDPLVVTIGTEGNAPILGRQIKSRIEIMLEPRLGALVDFAGRMRKTVAQNVPASKRRAFWRQIFDGPVRQEFSAGNERRSFDLFKSRIDTPVVDPAPSGNLSVVVAATRDADMVTLRDLRLLQEADTIFYEADLHEDVLELARRDAERTAYRYSPRAYPALARLFQKPAAEGQNVVVLTARSLSICRVSGEHEPVAAVAG
jgi:uroporphyrin-III C-methyltransferase/precorrin-2 dehydrogenase/sirohydrochlorin ferrochelatase